MSWAGVAIAASGLGSLAKVAEFEPERNRRHAERTKPRHQLPRMLNS